MQSTPRAEADPNLSGLSTYSRSEATPGASCYSHAEATPGPVSPPVTPQSRLDTERDTAQRERESEREDDLLLMFPTWLMGDHEEQEEAPLPALPALSAPPLPELLPTEQAAGPPPYLLAFEPVVVNPALQEEEEALRRRLCASVFPARSRLRSMVVMLCRTAADVRTFVQWRVWDCPQACLLLAVAVAEANEGIVEELLTRTAFSNLHSVAPESSTVFSTTLGVDPSFLKERGALTRYERSTSFVALAMNCLGEALRGGDAAGIRRRVAVLVLLCGSRYLCWDATRDAGALVALKGVLTEVSSASTDGSEVSAARRDAAEAVAFWSPHITTARCPHVLCMQGSPNKAHKTALKWTPQTAHHFARPRKVCTEAVAKVLTRFSVASNLVTVLEMLDWRFEAYREVDPNYPQSLLVCDFTPACGGLVALDASRYFMQHFSTVCGKAIACGTLVCLQNDKRGPALVTGCAMINQRLHLIGRRRNTPHSVPILGIGDPHKLLLIREAATVRKGVWWLCGACHDFVHPSRCTRCRRTLDESILAVQGRDTAAEATPPAPVPVQQPAEAKLPAAPLAPPPPLIEFDS